MRLCRLQTHCLSNGLFCFFMFWWNRFFHLTKPNQNMSGGWPLLCVSTDSALFVLTVSIDRCNSSMVIGNWVLVGKGLFGNLQTACFAIFYFDETGPFISKETGPFITNFMNFLKMTLSTLYKMKRPVWNRQIGAVRRTGPFIIKETGPLINRKQALSSFCHFYILIVWNRPFHH